LNNSYFKFLVIFRHEKNPKGWIGVQLLGCSSFGSVFYFYPPIYPSLN
jgi:hypothetical protein